MIIYGNEGSGSGECATNADVRFGFFLLVLGGWQHCCSQLACTHCGTAAGDILGRFNPGADPQPALPLSCLAEINFHFHHYRRFTYSLVGMTMIRISLWDFIIHFLLDILIGSY